MYSLARVRARKHAALAGSHALLLMQSEIDALSDALLDAAMTQDWDKCKELLLQRGADVCSASPDGCMNNLVWIAAVHGQAD